ncbi:MAG: hypothetical protein IJC34_05410, partial [Lentisphaeria bacterium]|nr:hypothetical protein [Lentisphaeria bacterium]
MQGAEHPCAWRSPENKVHSLWLAEHIAQGTGCGQRCYEYYEFWEYYEWAMARSVPCAFEFPEHMAHTTPCATPVF